MNNNGGVLVVHKSACKVYWWDQSACNRYGVDHTLAERNADVEMVAQIRKLIADVQRNPFGQIEEAEGRPHVWVWSLRADGERRLHGCRGQSMVADVVGFGRDCTEAQRRQTR
jgi:Txe/YoeB family toxin of Txe-Axe toxin-antitoxin module